MQTPLILTVQLDKDSQLFFNEKRKQYFPAERNFLDAHLTLFHHLPCEAAVIQTIETVCLPQKKMELHVTMPVSIGKGVAYKIESNGLVAFHNKLRKEWMDVLTPQDKQGLWPHITIQNKVSAEEAKQTWSEAGKAFIPFTAFAEGVSVWRYLNGPWQWYRAFPFAG